MKPVSIENEKNIKKKKKKKKKELENKWKNVKNVACLISHRFHNQFQQKFIAK